VVWLAALLATAAAFAPPPLKRAQTQPDADWPADLVLQLGDDPNWGGEYLLPPRLPRRLPRGRPAGVGRPPQPQRHRARLAHVSLRRVLMSIPAAPVRRPE